MTGVAKAIMWFRRDLRLTDHPALAEAIERGDDGVVPVFVVDPRLWDPAGPSRRAYLVASLKSLRKRIGGLVVRAGDPVAVIPDLARETGASTVHISADYGPYGTRRDRAVEAALAAVPQPAPPDGESAGVPLLRRGSPYAVDPGVLRTRGGGPFQVYTPFSRAWSDHGWPGPCPMPDDPDWDLNYPTDPFADVALPDRLELPPAGESAALRRWAEFSDERIRGYRTDRERPDLDRTSRLSVHLKWGEIHPRTLLAGVDARAEGPRAYRSELAWREFYADVLWHRPESARSYYRREFADMAYDQPGDGFAAWCAGRTGYPLVDAGIRQLAATGWMHNRVRMVVASFLVKDLHLEWQHGARHFMRWLVDGDLASNQHGWQWTAGCGTDAAPYFRVFNPTTQATTFDPDGAYIRRWLPERRDDGPGDVHEPRSPILDHAVERAEALRRYQVVKASRDQR
jgi:deoxyribodipyrimidine photo-lyase